MFRRLLILILTLGACTAGGTDLVWAAVAPGDDVTYTTGSTARTGVVLSVNSRLVLVARDGTTSTQDHVPPSVVKPKPTPTATPTATPTPTPTATPVADQYPLRGMFFRQSNGGFNVIASKGFNLIDSTPGEVAGLSPGLKGLTWVGDYNKTACTFEQSDAQITSYVQAHFADPKVGVWFISDEPWQGGTPHCPNAPAQHAARSNLIHSIDPGAKTLIVLDGNSDHESLDQLPAWRGAADYIGVNAYICWQGQSCHYEWIDQIGQAANAAAVPLWGVIQAHGEPDGQGQTMCVVTSGGGTACGQTRLPTPAEIHEQFVHWRATSMLSYLVFSWRWPDNAPSFWLENQPALQDQLAIENGAGPTPTPTATPSPTPTPTPTPSPTPTAGDPVVTIAGDIADDGDGDTGTAQAVQSVNPDRVLTAGDNAYPDGSLSDYTSWYAPTWGAFKAKTRPAPGNHDYHTSGAAGYFDYYDGVGASTGPAGDRGNGYYSFDLGAWHLIALNNYVSMSAGSAQEQWLKADLAATAKPCIAAYWHEPRFTSGSVHGNNTSVGPLWTDLYAAGADLVLNGHNHQYERFARQSPSGAADPAGIREFVVGTGGAGLYAFASPQPNSEVRNGTTHGVLKLTLRDGSYDWDFRPSDGTFTDTGTNTCH